MVDKSCRIDRVAVGVLVVVKRLIELGVGIEKLLRGRQAGFGEFPDVVEKPSQGNLQYRIVHIASFML
jgi:hypothetical protein